jgi:UDP-N-acetylmuramyl tripeptide synthase
MEAIFEDMKPEMLSGSCVVFGPIRAIALALKEARKDDTILIVGGHETYQQIGDEKFLSMIGI